MPGHRACATVTDMVATTAGSSRRELIMQGLIQVAGIIDQAEADMIIEEGADWLGFALRLPAKNEDLSEADAAAIIKKIQPEHKGVIITYLTDADEIAAFCQELGVSAIQLHGDVAPEQLRRLRAIAPDLYVLKTWW
jgi:phosphoribosylanthranilate isomerase